MSIIRALVLCVFLLLCGFVGGMLFTDSLYHREALPVLEVEESPDPLPYVLPLDYVYDVLWWSEKTGIPISTACRLFSVESSPSGLPTDPRWNPLAISWAGAVGVAQLMPFNLSSPLFLSFNEGKEIDPRDAKTSIKVGLRYLRYIYSLKESEYKPMQSRALRLAVGGYNGGPFKHSAFWKPETVNYVQKILGRSR